MTRSGSWSPRFAGSIDLWFNENSGYVDIVRGIRCAYRNPLGGVPGARTESCQSHTQHTAVRTTPASDGMAP